MSTISKLATELSFILFLKNISEFHVFGAVIFFDMVLLGLNSAVTEEETFKRNLV